MAIELTDRANKNFDILNKWNAKYGTPAKGHSSYLKLTGISEKHYGPTAFIVVVDYEEENRHQRKIGHMDFRTYEDLDAWFKYHY